ncbi:MAG: Crp/Fnr family transcriptional regulator [Alphaproteobacteria bacterium]|nr:Crp/Fnr family transcriptional regulator [Alphaproteobacteria bacterium]MBV9554384.1 Crp/Fnr family transcriptional regulator [Alphaproteobacteria bacterium]
MASERALPLTQKLARLIELSADEAAVLAEFQGNPRRIARGREIVVEGRKYDQLLVLLDGMAVRYRVLQDGRRQILNIALPGDLIGFPGCFFEHALYSISALGECTVSPLPFAGILALFETRPRLAAAIFWSLSCETALYAEHLIDVGRRSAIERVAHFLLEMQTRLQAIGLAGDDSYRLPLTQELLADALGLSVQYVNQTLRQLREENLVIVERQQVTILDYDALAALADFERTYINRFRIAEFAAAT